MLGVGSGLIPDPTTDLPPSQPDSPWRPGAPSPPPPHAPEQPPPSSGSTSSTGGGGTVVGLDDKESYAGVLAVADLHEFGGKQYALRDDNGELQYLGRDVKLPSRDVNNRAVSVGAQVSFVSVLIFRAAVNILPPQGV